MSVLTSKISDLNKKLEDVEDEIKLAQSRTDEYSSKIPQCTRSWIPGLQEQWKISNDVVSEVKLKKRQILDEISSLISSEQAEITINPDILNNRIGFLGLNNREKNICRGHGLIFVGDLVQKTEKDLRYLPNLGLVTINHINKALEGHGLRLGTKIGNWARPIIEVK